MDFTTLEPALLAWFATLSGIDPLLCVFENTPRPRGNGRLGLLAWVSSAGVGVDDFRWEYDALEADPLKQMTPTIAGPRVLALQLAVESWDQRPGYGARATLERVRDRLRAPSSLATLAAARVGLVGASVVTPADYPADGLMVSRCVMDLRLNAAAFYADTAGQTSYIATVGVTASITDPAGDALPSSLQPSGSVP